MGWGSGRRLSNETGKWIGIEPKVGVYQAWDCLQGTVADVG